MEQKKSKFYAFLEPVIPKFLRPTVLKYQEILSYLVFGVLSTVVNFAVYFPINLFAPGIVANIPAWVAAVAFSFVTNKAFVFENGGSSPRSSSFLRLGSRWPARSSSSSPTTSPASSLSSKIKKAPEFRGIQELFWTILLKITPRG